MHELESSLEINKFHIINILEMFDLMSLTSLSTYKVRPEFPRRRRGRRTSPYERPRRRGCGAVVVVVLLGAHRPPARPPSRSETRV